MAARKRRINLALQGGGAHGAFTWGVLDRLLEDDTIEITGISGTSAGALNGAALKAGLVEGGRQGARDTLDWLWEQVGAVGDMRLAHWMTALTPSPGSISKAIESSFAYGITDAMSRVFSPYSYGPFYQNPLSRVVERFEYASICANADPALFVCATNVRTGKVKVFSGDEITADAILASACLPTVFKAVEIGEDVYWDGGYTGNPALFPLFAPELPSDIVIVNINPLERDEVPMDSHGILNRINEISFNSSLLRELRAIDFVQRLIADDKVSSDAMKKVRVHMIADDELMTELSVASKLVPTPQTLKALFEAGRRATDGFLEGDAKSIGKRSSVDLPEMFG
ncbi:MAG: patatin-like phospholipase family protein [Paracoccaceae bacterium]